MKQFVIRYQNVTMDLDLIETTVPFSQYPLTDLTTAHLKHSDPKEIFGFLFNEKRKTNTASLVFKLESPLSISKDNTIVTGYGRTGLLMVKYVPEESSLYVYYNLDEKNTQSNLFSKALYPLLEAFSNIPDDIREGELVYTNGDNWLHSPYLEKLLNKDYGEAATLAAFRDLSLHELSYLTTEHSHYKELREAILYWLSNSTTGVFRNFIESTIKTQQLIIGTKL